MIQRTANAVWKGDLKQGKGTLKLGSGVFTANYSFASRFEAEKNTNPEELIGAAHAGCFSMALSAELSKAGYQVEEINTEAVVSLEKGDDGFAISGIKLSTKAKIKDIKKEEFLTFASSAKENCPISKALGAVDISLEAHLL